VVIRLILKSKPLSLQILRAARSESGSLRPDRFKVTKTAIRETKPAGRKEPRKRVESLTHARKTQFLDTNRQKSNDHNVLVWKFFKPQDQKTPCSVLFVPIWYSLKSPISRHRFNADIPFLFLIRCLSLLDTVNVILSGLLVLLRQVVACVLAEPLGHLVQLLAKTAHSLRVHVGMGNQVWHGY
jgi:hypothetical protein